MGWKEARKVFGEEITFSQKSRGKKKKKKAGKEMHTNQNLKRA